MLAPNSTLQQGRYDIDHHLSSGAMGAVYKAYDNHLKTNVAIKEALVTHPALRKAFKREAQRLARLHHSSLPNVLDHFSEGNRQYLVMRFIEGQDWQEMLAQRGRPFAAAQVVRWAEQLLETLAYLHSEGVIHRDIKPANVKLTLKGDLFLLDLGIAKGGLTGSLGTAGSIHGFTPGYASPEQMTGRPTDARSDIYSVGATLYTLLTNQTPPNATNRFYEVHHGQPDLLRPAHQLNPNIPLLPSRLLSWSQPIPHPLPTLPLFHPQPTPSNPLLP